MIFSIKYLTEEQSFIIKRILNILLLKKGYAIQVFHLTFLILMFKPCKHDSCIFKTIL